MQVGEKIKGVTNTIGIGGKTIIIVNYLSLMST